MSFDENDAINLIKAIIECLYPCGELKIDAEKLMSLPAEILVTNKSEDWLAFKLSVSNPESFQVIKPCSTNILGPGECLPLEISLQRNYDDDKNYYHVCLEAAFCAWKPKKETKFNVNAGWKDVEPKDVVTLRIPIKIVENKEPDPFEICMSCTKCYQENCDNCDEEKITCQKMKTVMKRMQQDGSIPDGLVFLLTVLGVGVLIGYATSK